MEKTIIGTAVLVQSENELNHVKSLLRNKTYIPEWVEQMSTNPTAIIIESDSGDDVGSVGCQKFIEDSGFRIVKFENYFALHINYLSDVAKLNEENAKKAEKWDRLEEEIASYYANDCEEDEESEDFAEEIINGFSEDEDFEPSLIEIGEAAAKAFGFM